VTCTRPAECFYHLLAVTSSGHILETNSLFVHAAQVRHSEPSLCSCFLHALCEVNTVLMRGSVLLGTNTYSSIPGITSAMYLHCMLKSLPAVGRVERPFERPSERFQIPLNARPERKYLKQSETGCNGSAPST